MFHGKIDGFSQIEAGIKAGMVRPRKRYYNIIFFLMNLNVNCSQLENNYSNSTFMLTQIKSIYFCVLYAQDSWVDYNILMPQVFAV